MHPHATRASIEMDTDAGAFIVSSSHDTKTEIERRPRAQFLTRRRADHTFLLLLEHF
jgi:hypothetical protein